jgi:hypothetical protein
MRSERQLAAENMRSEGVVEGVIGRFMDDSLHLTQTVCEITN